jgi:hypothetical protein
MKFSDEDLFLIINDYHEDFRDIDEGELVYHHRWSIGYQKVVCQISTGTYYKINWQQPATECQECDLNASAVQVYPHNVTKIIWIEKED